MHFEPEGVRFENGQRYVLFQVWEFEGDIYEISLYVVKDEGGPDCQTQVMRGHYYAIGSDKLMRLLTQAGYEQVERLDGVFFQPVIMGKKPQM